ncbi:NUDIX domain-containing protein [Bacillus sp. LL01]|uniref:NUDIX domain-containing protein n=1 Tax=Bacillus sp. LL01 TaxID=1665556 RepID=UPI00069D0C6D
MGTTNLVVNKKPEIFFQLLSDNLYWGLPGGGMEIMQTLEEVASRELKEETGLEAEGFESIN